MTARNVVVQTSVHGISCKLLLPPTVEVSMRFHGSFRELPRKKMISTEVSNERNFTSMEDAEAFTGAIKNVK